MTAPRVGGMNSRKIQVSTMMMPLPSGNAYHGHFMNKTVINAGQPFKQQITTSDQAPIMPKMKVTNLVAMTKKSNSK